MEDLRTSIAGLADQIVSRPDERALLGKALRLKIGELRKRGDPVPPEILDLEAKLERLEVLDGMKPRNDRPA